MAYGHYVPQFYIRNFGLNEKQTARFDKITNDKKLVSEKANSFASVRDSK